MARTNSRRVLLPLFLISSMAPAQEFDVSSIKPHREPVTLSSDPAIRGRRVMGTACTLLDLITYAHNVRYDQITGGPPWAGTDHYDLAAVAEPTESALTIDQARQMVQALLAERFQLRVRREKYEGPIYALVVGKSGPKFKEALPDQAGRNLVRGDNKGLHMEAPTSTMADLVRQLSHTAGRPVVDRTSLSARYTFTLDWYPADRIAPPELDTPTMFEAVQRQLGLKLEPTTGPRERLVIEHAEKPSAN